MKPKQGNKKQKWQAHVGDTMFVPILDFQNIKAVLMEVDDSDNFKLRMEHGVYKVNSSLLSRNFLTSLMFQVRLYYWEKQQEVLQLDWAKDF